MTPKAQSVKPDNPLVAPNSAYQRCLDTIAWAKGDLAAVNTLTGASADEKKKRGDHVIFHSVQAAYFPNKGGTHHRDKGQLPPWDKPEGRLREYKTQSAVVEMALNMGVQLTFAGFVMLLAALDSAPVREALAAEMRRRIHEEVEKARKAAAEEARMVLDSSLGL
jgi:hypothetical protein